MIYQISGLMYMGTYWSVSTWCILENLFVQTIFLRNIQKNTRYSFVNSLFIDIINTVHLHHNSFVILIIGWGVPTKSTNIKPPLIQVIPQNRIVQFVSIFFQKKWRFSPVIFFNLNDFWYWFSSSSCVVDDQGC